MLLLSFAENQTQVDKDDIEKEYDQHRAGIGSTAFLAQRRHRAADGRWKHLHRRVADGVRKIKITDDTVAKYIGYLEEAFLFNEARRYNIKGKKYYENIKKYYSIDVGLRNARLNYRQLEQTHLMENIIFNELLYRGYVVDVGVVEHRKMVDGKSEYKQYEVDFIATDGNEKYYIQSAYEIETEEKREQELNSLKRIDDSFQKIVIVKDDIMPYRDNNGILFTGLFQFLFSDKFV